MHLPEGVTLHMGGPDDETDLLAFLCGDFIETHARSVLGGSREFHANEMRGALHRALHDLPSLVYFLRNEKGEIVALRSAMSRTRGEQSYRPMKPEDDHIHPIREFMRKMFEEIDMWNTLPKNIDKIVWISFTSVRADYTRKGLMKYLMYVDSDQKKRDLGFQAEVVIGAAFKSQNLFKSCGFEVIKEVRHEDICYSNGGQILRCNDGTESHQLMIREL